MLANPMSIKPIVQSDMRHMPPAQHVGAGHCARALIA